MRSQSALLLAGLSVWGMVACAKSKAPSETSISNASPLTITVPKDLEGSDKTLKGIRFRSVDYTQQQGDILPGVHSTANTILDFFSVGFSEPAPGQLTTTMCRGEQYDDGHRDKSCVAYDARVVITEEADQSRIIITPIKMRAEQGRNGIFLPINLPKFDLSDWYRYVSDQLITAKYKVTSKYGPESIKGNYDRSLPKKQFSEGEADGALRQFKDAYLIDEKGEFKVIVRAAFYPYRDGSMVEFYLEGDSRDKKTITSVDWKAALASTKSKLDKIANE